MVTSSTTNVRLPTVRAYRCETNEDFQATIFAHSFDEAATFFCVHHDTILARMPTEFTISIVKRPKPGFHRRHLKEALDRGVSGVGLYLAGRGWTVVAPDQRMRFEAEPPELPPASPGEQLSGPEHADRATPSRRQPKQMRAFRVTSPDHRPLVIFAEGSAKAAEIVVTWRGLNGHDDTNYEFDTEWTKTLDIRERVHLREALSWGSSGIGKNYRSDIGWGIAQPWDERP